MNGHPAGAQPNNEYAFDSCTECRTDNPRIYCNVTSDLACTAECETSSSLKLSQATNFVNKLSFILLMVNYSENFL